MQQFSLSGLSECGALAIGEARSVYPPERDATKMHRHGRTELGAVTNHINLGAKPARSTIVAAAIALGGVSQSHAQQVDEALLSSFSFRAIGPSSTGGRILDIAVDPSRPATIYAAAASGGLWKTVNNGTTWDCVFENEGTISIGDIAVDPSNPETVWVGSGEANNQRSSYWGDGIYKSTDGGETWANMGLEDTQHIGRVVVHPTNGDIVYVAAAGALYSHNPERGVYKTSDGGETWEHVLFISDAVGVIDLVLDPVNPDTVYAASYERLRRAWDFDGNGPGSAIYKSTDGGANWTKQTDGLPEGDIGRIGIDVFAGDPKIVYASVANQNEVEIEPEPSRDGSNRLGFRAELTGAGAKVTTVQRNGPAADAGLEVGDVITEVDGDKPTNFWAFLQKVASLGGGDEVELTIDRDGEEMEFTLEIPLRTRQIGGEIYKSEDYGETWVKVNEDPVGGSPAYYYGQIRIDPNDSDQLYLCSVPLHRSNDGGVTWTGDGARSVHVDHHAVWINPDNSEHILLGNDGGFHVSWDKGATWDHVFNLPLPQFYAIGFDYQQPYHVYGGTQDNGSHGGPSKSRSGRVGRWDWYRVGGGDGFYVEVDPNNSDIVFAESQFGGITRLDKSTGNSVSIRPRAPQGEQYRFNWMSPIVISNHNPQIIYFGGNKLFKSYNRGDDWHVVSPDLTTADEDKLAGNVPHCTITTVDESRFDPNVLIAGTDDGNVQWTNDGGISWTNMADRFPDLPANFWCSRVVLSAHDEDTAYAAFTGYREDNRDPYLYRTTDRGETWVSVVGNLPDESINVVRESPYNENVLFVGTELSVFMSIDGGEHWVELTEGIPTIPVHDLKIHPRDRDLIVGTHGRGMFILDDIVALEELTSEVLDSNVHLFSLRDSLRYRRTFGGGGISGDRSFTAPNPSSGATITYYLKDDVDEDDISIQVRNAAGEVIRELDADHTAGIHRVNWDLRPRRQDGGQQGGRRFGGRFGGGAAMVDAGTYTVELLIGDDMVATTVEVITDPLPGADEPAPEPED